MFWRVPRKRLKGLSHLEQPFLTGLSFQGKTIRRDLAGSDSRPEERRMDPRCRTGHFSRFLLRVLSASRLNQRLVNGLSVLAHPILRSVVWSLKALSLLAFVYAPFACITTNLWDRWCRPWFVVSIEPIEGTEYWPVAAHLVDYWHRLQYIYQLACSMCSCNYGANGSDIHERLCPNCQKGKPGLIYGN
jgi:hypothetical protein